MTETYPPTAASLLPAATSGNRPQLPEEVATYVRELIISGTVRPGDFLRMERIAEAVGVSNTPVREGLLALQGEGFVRLVPRRGFVVAPLTRQDVRDVFFAQAQLARELAGRAAKNISTRDLDQLESINGAYDAAMKTDDTERMASLGHAFHRVVNLSADSPRLTLLLGTLARHIPNRFYASIESHAAATSNEHPQILEALRKRNARKASAIMDSHIMSGGDQLIEILEERGLWAWQDEDAAS